MNKNKIDSYQGLWSVERTYSKGDVVMASYDIYDGKPFAFIRRLFARLIGKRTHVLGIFKCVDVRRNGSGVFEYEGELQRWEKIS